MALAWAFKTKRSCHVIARPLDYAPMGRILNEIRSAAGNQVIDKNNSSSMISRVLRKKESLGILLDQSASWYEGVYVPFFGQLACTNKGLALFALRYDAPVVPAFNFRQPDGRYKIVIESPLKLIRTGNINEDIMTNTERFNQVIEKYIRKAPDNWLWVHRRWRIVNIPESHRWKFDAAVERYPQAFKGASSGDRYGSDQ
jgi:KDO2-lipid IV(A) lauroyltransferase